MTCATPAAILIVEDERIVAKDLQQTLTDMGYDAYGIAGSAEEALAHAMSRTPDIVMMDIRIRGPLDGIQTAAMLKEKFNSAVIFLTAHADAAMIERAKLTEPHSYLFKPVNHRELQSNIEIALYRRQAEAARAHSAQLELKMRVAEESTRFKHDIINHIAHELRTPLNGVMGFATLMHEGMAGPTSEKNKEFLRLVLTSGRHFVDVINDVILLSSIEAGRAAMDLQSFDLPAVVDEVVGKFRPLLHDNGQGIATDFDSEYRTLFGDRSMTKQILSSYVSNAIKFTPNGGAIVIRAQAAEPEAIRVEVIMSDVADSESDIDRLFATFGNSDANPSNGAPVAGLGLVLAKRLAEAQGGRVDARRSPAGGSIFAVTLPRRADKGPRDPASPAH